MRGTIFRRGKAKNRWAIVLDRGYIVDPETGKKKRSQTWVSFKGTKKQAEDKCNELVGQVNRNEFVEPSKMTVGQWLDQWLEVKVKPHRRPHTYKSYSTVVERHLKPALGHILLQQLQAIDIERFHARQAKLKASSRQTHQAVLSNALKSAAKARLVQRSVASDVEGKPKAQRTTDDLIAQCWSAEDARAFLVATKSESPQVQAFFATALDTGARKGELHGLRWEDVNLDAGTLRIVRQLYHPGKRKVGEDGEVRIEPVFGDTKTKKPRTIDLGPDTVRLLREHRRKQLEVKMKNRDIYRDHGLVFACELRDPRDPGRELGMALSNSTLGSTVFSRLTKAAGVKRIKFHGMRHTCATLMLGAGVPVKIVSERLGHSNVMITLNTYAHVLPGMQKEAASQLGALLHG
jgi:integrase